MLTGFAKFLGLVLAVVCVYLFARETGVLNDLWCWLRDNLAGSTQFFAGVEFHRMMMAGIYLIGAVAGLLLFIFANGRR